MIFQIIIAIILIIMLLIYGAIRLKKAIQISQQSSYDLNRLTKYIKEAKTSVFPSHDITIVGLITFITLLSLIDNNVIIIIVDILLIIAIAILFFNLDFQRLERKYFIEKKPVVYTNRVKRIILILTILIIIYSGLIMGIIYLINSSSLLIAVALVIASVSLLCYLFTYASIFVLEPYEKKVRLKFQKQAKAKIAANTRLLTVGITGSYGKTSIKNIIYQIIEKQKRTLMTPESYNTPNGLTITINKYLNNFHEVFLAEMGAYYEGEIKELVELTQPKIGIVSSIGPQHLETFGSLETVQKTKMELIEGLPSDGLGILNYDNEYIRNYQLKNDVEIKYYSLENPENYLYITEIEYLEKGMRFKAIIEQNEEYYFETKLLGRHNLYNIAAALIVAKYLDLDFSILDDSIRRIDQIKHRLELKEINENLLIIDDAFNGNYEGIKEGINILNNFQEYERIIITPGIIDLGEKQFEINEKLAQESIYKVDYMYIVGETNREALKSGLKEDDNVEIYEFANFIEAYNHAVNIQKPKIILIANDLPDKFN